MSQNFMFYKGYTGAVEYSDVDGCFVGEVVGLTKTLIGFHGDSVAELRKDFENGIDSYLAACAELGRNPEMPAETEITVTVPTTVYQTIFEKAEKSGKSVSDIAVAAFNAAGFGRGKRRKTPVIAQAQRKPRKKTTVR
jgi:Uncharacterized protein encoded in hypervariable junctions of pilus gene clusters